MTARKPDTDLTHLGRPDTGGRAFVNPAIQRGSTVLFPTVAEMRDFREDPFAALRYGRQGTPTHRACEAALAALEHGHWTFLTSSGLSAITLTLLAHAAAGAHMLVTDNCYGPTRDFAATVLTRYGVEVEFFDAALGGDIRRLFRPNTALLYMESPGSVTFEVTDVPAMAAAARDAEIVSAIDNTWGTPLFFRPLDHGVDIVIHSATKYILGHADGMMGVVTCNEAATPALKTAAFRLGAGAAPEDAYLALRGLRTLSVRLERHHKTALALADWLRARPEVERVLYPALPGAPGHDLWRRDFTGASGLFSVVLKPVANEAVARMAESLELFKLGFSWGGYESLIVPELGGRGRTAMPWPGPGPVIRLHAGLEDADDLKDDLAQGLRRLK